MKFLIEAADSPHPYYHNIPENFLIPAIFFPQTIINSRGFTLGTYALEYSWHIKFFAKDTQLSQAMAFASANAIQYTRNRIPIIDVSGNLTDNFLRLKAPSIRPVSDGVVQLSLSWESSHYYKREEIPAMEILELIKFKTRG